MNTVIHNRLPGVYFQVAPPLPAEPLPRMDIAAFVGLATSGPLHTPVPLEDVARFREIFGADLPLAWDTTTGQMQYAHLGPTVEAFFRNGGRRCWVVRVAGEATVHHFSLRHLVGADDRQSALVRARCAGSWSDSLRVGTRLQSQMLTVRFERQAHPYRVEVVSTPRKLQRGDLLRLTFGDTDLVLFLAVEAVEAVPSGQHVMGTPWWFSHQHVESYQWLTASSGLERAAAWQATSSPPAEPTAALLTFEFVVWRDEQIVARLDQLAFSQQHPRFWGHLPVDEALFRLPDREPVQTVRSSLLAEATEPRFPLAGPAMPAQLYLPLGMPATPALDTAQAPAETTLQVSRLERDGLKRFSADVFLDNEVARVGSDALLAEAHHKYYLQHRPLRGLHSLLPVEEVTLVAVPDAVQPGWQEAIAPSLDLLLAPVLALLPRPDEEETTVLTWSAVAQDAAYTLQEAVDPTFAQSVPWDQGKQTTASVPAKTNCPQRYYYRVRARRGNTISPWSNTVSAVIPPQDFQEYQTVVLEAPQLQLLPQAAPLADHYHLDWKVVDGATGYVVQEAADPAFTLVSTIYTGDETTYSVKRSSQRVYYYRVRAQSQGVSSPWSNTQHFVVWLPHRWSLQPLAHYNNGDLLAVQRALLRFCAARGDLLTVLALPQHYREAEVLAHVAALTPHLGGNGEHSTGAGEVRVMPLTPSEDRVLSYGALYHPWMTTRIEKERGKTTLRCLPPDGAVCGTMAAGAIARGAWVAPANVPMQGVVSLTPALSRQGWASLFEAQVNVVQQEPRGFLLFSAETLSPEAALRPLNVRRLLILLRRLVWREGMAYVFEPNDASFRRLVQRRFAQWLSDLYSRGAFAGNTPASSYQVITDTSINTPTSLEQGRFIVELRVAPSRPMAFLTVRLLQMGHEALLIQEG